MSHVEENVFADPPNVGRDEEEEPENSSAPPTMFKIVKMCKLRWQVLLVEAPEGKHYPFGLERCLSVNAIKKPSQQLKSRRRWSALLPSSPKSKVLECQCRPVAGDPPAVSPCPGGGGDVQDSVNSLASKASSCCETRTGGSPLRSSEQCPKHGVPCGRHLSGPHGGHLSGPHGGPLSGPHGGPLGGPLGDLLFSPLSHPEELVSSAGDHGDVAQAEPAPRKSCYATANSGSGAGTGTNSHLKAKKAASSEQRVLTPVQHQRLAKRDSLQTVLPLSRKIKLLSKESLKATKTKKDFSQLKSAQTFNNRKCPKCPFCYQHHD